jgi:hypothetical protein
MLYETELTYLVDFYTVKDLISDESFDDLEAFVQMYKEKMFEGSVFNGLSFGEENNLTQHTDNNRTEAGSYEIKRMNNQEVLFLYPDNTKRYGSNACFILDFTRVWKAECQLKGNVEKVNFYDKDVYNNVLKYMQAAFVNVEISI